MGYTLSPIHYDVITYVDTHVGILYVFLLIYIPYYVIIYCNLICMSTSTLEQ